MEMFTEVLLAIYLMLCISLACSSRLLHCIRITAAQGLAVALFPLAAWNWKAGVPAFGVLFVAAAGLVVKALLLPVLLERTMRKAHVKRELEPMIGYTQSLMLVLCAGAAAFYFCRRMTVPEGASPLGPPTAFTVMFTGLLMIVARRKAITQAIGFLTFENGISLFGMSMLLESGFLVELGILLDVFVLVFVMGIAVFHISREFAHIDADRLHQLNDDTEEEEVRS